MLTQKELEAIRKRAEKVTEGPWVYGYDDMFRKYYIEDNFGKKIIGMADSCDDTIFITYARTDIPKLLAEIDRLKELNSELIDVLFGDAVRKSTEVLVEEIRKKVGR